MKKIVIYLPIIILSLFCLGQKAKSSDQGVSMGVDSAIRMSTDTTDLRFNRVMVGGKLVFSSAGIVISVTTNSPNGYSLGIYDNAAGSNSSLQTQTLAKSVSQTIYLPDFNGTIDQPKLWDKDKSKGFGFSVYLADTNKEAKWGNGQSNTDGSNRYAGIPQRATVFHSSPGFKTTTDKTSISFIVGIGQDQNLGTYTGSILLTATAVLN